MNALTWVFSSCALANFSSGGGNVNACLLDEAAEAEVRGFNNCGCLVIITLLTGPE